MTDENQLSEHAANREDRYLQLIMKARDEAEKVDDQETIEKLEELYDKITDKIEDIDKERRQKVLDSQIWALEKEIEVYGEAIEEVKALVK
jgi:hypothetical protein